MATMITPEFVQTLARYNQWQNRSLYCAAQNLSDDERRKNRGAFFGSIHGTLCHLVWGDQMWMHRFAGTSTAKVAGIGDSPSMIEDWTELCAERDKMDALVREWANSLQQEQLSGELVWYSGAAGREVSRPVGLLVVHMFNHQTHHRGQVHAMITAAGGRPDDTDLFMMPET